jgi:chromosome segregation ATPase
MWAAPVAVDASDDDDSDDGGVDSLGLGGQPGSLLVYLRLKRDAFLEDIESLGVPAEPLLRKYSAILNQLERETNYTLAGLDRLFTAFTEMSREHHLSQEGNAFLKKRLDTFDQWNALAQQKIDALTAENAVLNGLNDAREKKDVLDADLNRTLSSDLSDALEDKRRLEAEVDRLAHEVELLQEQNASLYDKNEREAGASAAKIKQLTGETEMQKIRISNQTEQIMRTDSMFGEEKRERLRLERIVRDHNATIQSLKRQVKELTEKADYYKDQRNKYFNRFGALPR